MRKFFIVLVLIPVICFGNSPELSLPSVPTELRQPKERAAYILGHFWDAMDFENTRLSRDFTFMEQNMVNYLSLFPHADAAALPEAVDTLLSRASADRKALRLVLDLAEQYLYDPYSPMRNEEHYIVFLEAQLRLPALAEADRLRPQFQLEEALKNRVGTPAADFSFTDRNGCQRSLYELPAEPLLLVFYSPDCDHCTEVLNELKDFGDLKIVAVASEEDRSLWEQSAPTLPAEWIVGISSDVAELYSIPALPTLYYLSPTKIVEKKALTIE